MSAYVIDILHCEVDRIPFVRFSVAGVGSCEMRLAGCVADLRGLFVREDHRRMGYATKLFDCARAIAIEYGKSALSFTVRRDNRVALRFYAKMGCDIFFDDGQDYWMGVVLHRIFPELRKDGQQ